MVNGWYHHSHRETRQEFETRSLELSRWIWSLLDSQPSLSDSQKLISNSSSLPSTSTYVFVLHGYLLTTLINQLIFSQPSSFVLVHNNTGITHLELVQFQSGAYGSIIQSMNNLPHLHGHSHLLTGNDLINDQWVKIFQ